MTDTSLMIAAADALREAVGARARFPGNRLNHLATIEEVGEHAQALLEHSRGNKTAAEVYAEAIQCAAMYLRLATEGTAEVPYEFNPNLSKDFVATTPKAKAVPIVRPGDVVAAPARPPSFLDAWCHRPAPNGGAFPYHGLTPPHLRYGSDCPGPGERVLYLSEDRTDREDGVVPAADVKVG